MASQDIKLRLLKLDRSKRHAVISSAVDIYMRILFNIADDIYDSCIADYYNGYEPTSYKRHGNISGFNLYLANSISYQNNYLSVDIMEDKLLPYGKKTSREDVFENVITGKRGTGMGGKRAGWPRKWSTSYPNSYSRYRGVWSSGSNTIQGIYADFFQNGIKDTAELFWQCVDKLI